MSSRIRLRPDALEWREIDGEVVALDLRSSRYLAVNRTGTVIWPALLEGTTRAELVQTLMASFDLSEQDAAGDLDLFLGELTSQDLLER